MPMEHEDHEAANARIQAEWRQANNARDAARVAAALDAGKPRRATGPTFAPPAPAGTAMGRAVAKRAPVHVSAEEAAYVARIADERRIAEARRTDMPSRGFTAQPRPCSVDREASAKAKRIAREIAGNGAA